LGLAKKRNIRGVRRVLPRGVPNHPRKRSVVANCVTCGDELHPERAEKYDYCTRPDCRDRNAKGIEIVAVGVNKAADQYVVLNERTKKEMASGRYKKEPVVPGSSRPQPARRRGPARVLASRSSAASRPLWSEAQENLALIYRSMGMKPDEIARKLGVTPYLVTQILLAATKQGKR
jgi:hypothetical protein